VNLIGEFTDFNMGLVLPFAIERRVVVSVSLRSDSEVVVSSTRKRKEVSRKIREMRPSDSFTWASYVFGTVWAFRELGVDLPGLELSLDSDVPSGAGLSSSAAIEAAVATAINDIAAVHLDSLQLARLCHKAETEYVGVPVGMMDQLAVLNARPMNAMLIDCRDLSIRQIPFSPSNLLVVDTRVRHSNRRGGYALKRSQCAQAAAVLGVDSLRDADLTMVEQRLEGDLARVARHVVTENQRVSETVNRLSTGQPIGDVLLESHRSLQHSFGVSCQELDCVVDTAMSNGAEGARMFGAGNGGCAIVLTDDETRVMSRITTEFRMRGYRTPRGIVVSPGGCAGRVQ
jgi:galactokinase